MNMEHARRTAGQAGEPFSPAFALAACVAALAVGCGDTAGSGDSPRASAGALVTTVDTVGTWVRVTNSGAAPEWNLALAASVGPGRALGEATAGDFGQAVSVALGPGEDAVYVSDRQYCEVSVFGVDGEHRRTFGRCGEGPGEFSPFFYSIAWVGGKLLAFDFGGSRIGEFTAEGEWTGQRSVLGAMGGGSLFALFPANAGEAYARALTGDRAGAGTLAYSFIGHDAAGETADTVMPIAPPENAGGPTCQWGEGFLGFFRNPYAPRLLQHPGSGGTLYSAMSDQYRITVTRGADTVRVVERQLAPEPVAGDEWDALSREFDAWLEEKPGAICEPRSPRRPAARPVLEGIFFDATGRMWVEVARAAGARWEVFDPDGRLVAQMAADERKKDALPSLGADYAATIRQDSLDLDHVDIWRIERPGR